jgi:hypothetical protein
VLLLIFPKKKKRMTVYILPHSFFVLQMVMQHYSIITAVMELFSDKSDTVTAGFLSSLLGDGCECHGYNIAIVGHSLGGSVAALLGIKVSFFIL